MGVAEKKKGGCCWGMLVMKRVWCSEYVCVCARLSTQWFVYMYLFSIKSVHKWVYTPAHNLDSCVCTFCVFVCVELGKECAFD